MLTGDATGPAHSIAAAVGLPASNVHAALLPEDKLRLVSVRRAPQHVLLHLEVSSDSSLVVSSSSSLVVSSSNCVEVQLLRPLTGFAQQVFRETQQWCTC